MPGFPTHLDILHSCNALACMTIVTQILAEQQCVQSSCFNAPDLSTNEVYLHNFNIHSHNCLLSNDKLQLLWMHIILSIFVQLVL